MHISEVSGTASQVRSTSHEISANDPGLIKLGLQLRGYSSTPAGPMTLYFDDTFRMLVVMFPPEALQLNRRDIAALTASRVSGGKALARGRPHSSARWGSNCVTV